MRLKSSNLYKCSTFHESEGLICKEEGEFDKDLDIKYQNTRQHLYDLKYVILIMSLLMSLSLLIMSC